MAINAGTIWEVCTTGAVDNGGGYFNLVPGTSVDYSQQPNPQLSLSNITITADGLTIASVSGGFTEAMQGNIIYLTGGSSTPGWYQITSFISGTSVGIDRAACTGAKTEVSGKVGGQKLLGATLSNSFFSNLNKPAGNTVYIKSGAYTIGENIGATGNGYTVRGYSLVRDDTPVGISRPSLSFGSYNLVPHSGGSSFWYNLIITGTGTKVWNQSSTSYGICYNCKISNTSGSTGCEAVYVYNGEPTFISCEISSTLGLCVNALSVNPRFICCYLHNSNKGIATNGAVPLLYHCIFANFTVGSTPRGCYLTYNGGGKVIGCIFHNCTTGLQAALAAGGLIVTNNIFNSCATGLSFDVSGAKCFIDFNCWYNPGGTDVVNTVKGPNDISSNPLLIDPVNGDYRLGVGSPCINTGVQLGSLVGL